MDIIKVGEHGAVVEFFTQELRLLALGCREACELDHHGDFFEAMHAMFQALTLAADAYDGGSGEDDITWKAYDQERERRYRDRISQIWGENPIDRAPPTPAEQAVLDAEMLAAKAKGAVRHAEEARQKADAALKHARAVYDEQKHATASQVKTAVMYDAD